MKKKLEGELISIAHRVLKLKNKSETVQLQQEAKKIYEQLTILRFYEENFETIKNEISSELFEEKLEQIATIDSVETNDLEEKVVEISQPIINEDLFVYKEEIVIEANASVEEVVQENKVTEEPLAMVEEVQEIVEAPKEEVYATAEDINRILAEMAIKKNVSEEIPAALNKETESRKADEPQQISFEELLGESYKEPEFVRVDDTPKVVEQVADVFFEKKEEVIGSRAEEVEPKKQDYSFGSQTAEKQEVKSKSLNDKLTKSISFGLNDRIAFEKKLFNGSSDDFNRVISQLNTFDSFDEANSFISDFVKPDYKNWEGQEEYETRFLEIIEKKFN